jgi:hypothetical protein
MINEETLITLGEREFIPSECLKALQSNKLFYACWGVASIASVGKATDGWVKGLVLKVNGAKWSEYVFVSLSYADWYQVRLINRKGEVKDFVDEICFEDLNYTIDRLIETN